MLFDVVFGIVKFVKDIFSSKAFELFGEDFVTIVKNWLKPVIQEKAPEIVQKIEEEPDNEETKMLLALKIQNWCKEDPVFFNTIRALMNDSQGVESDTSRSIKKRYKVTITGDNNQNSYKVGDGNYVGSNIRVNNSKNTSVIKDNIITAGGNAHIISNAGGEKAD